MATIRTPRALRRALTTLRPAIQTRHARVLTTPHLTRPATGNRSLQTSSEAVLEKYRQKLEEKMKAEGVSSITELKKKYEDKIAAVRNDPTLPPLPAELLLDEDPSQTPAPIPTQTDPNAVIPPQPVIPPPRMPTNAPPPGVKTLASFVDLKKLTNLNSTEIEYLWRARHISDAQSLCAVAPASTFTTFYSLARQHPMFILPLPRENHGVEMHFLQWTFPAPHAVTVLFTSLAAYKLHGEFAVPHTTVTHHTELSEDKGLVLVQGTVVKDRGVTPLEARWLMVALQKFYGADKGTEVGKRRLALLEQFTKGGERFKIEDVIKEVEMAV